MFKKEYWIILLLIAVIGAVYALISCINFMTGGKLSKLVHKKISLGLMLVTFLGLLSNCALNPTLTGSQDESSSISTKSGQMLSSLKVLSTTTLAPTPSITVTPTCYTPTPPHSPTPTPSITPTCYTPTPPSTPTPSITITPMCYTPTPPVSPTPTPTSIVIPDYTVNYNIQSDWGNGAVINLVLKNNGKTDINGWTVAWTFSGNQIITNLWNGVVTQNHKAVSVTNVRHNAVIPANGGSISLGFQLIYNGTNAVPASIVLTPK